MPRIRRLFNFKILGGWGIIARKLIDTMISNGMARRRLLLTGDGREFSAAMIYKKICMIVYKV
ncbi:MAG: hypothetical protein ACR2PV_04560 [Gammaproteobacteria bacterium]